MKKNADRLEKYIDWIRRRRTARNRSVAVVIVLSMFMSINVFWNLRIVGNALSEEDIKGDPGYNTEQTVKTKESKETKTEEPDPGKDKKTEPAATEQTKKTEPSETTKEKVKETAATEETEGIRQSQPEETEATESTAAEETSVTQSTGTEEPEATKDSEERKASEETEITEETSASEPSQTEETKPAETSGETHETEAPDGSEPAETEPEEDLNFKAETESGIKVEVSAPSHAFPKGTKMRAEDVGEINIDPSDVKAGDKEVKGTVAVDIIFEAPDGTEIEPADGAKVNVNIEFPGKMIPEGDSYVLLHVEDDGVTSIDDAEVTGSQATFETDSFSIYVLTALGEKDKDHINEYLEDFPWMIPNAEGYIDNSADHPYYLTVGETFTIYGYGSEGGKDFYGFDGSIIQDTGSGHAGTYDSDKGKYKTERTYLALKAGTTRITFDSGYGNMEYFYVEVKDKAYSSDTNTIDLNFNEWDLSQHNSPNTAILVTQDDLIRIIWDRNAAPGGFIFVDANGNQITDTGYINYLLKDNNDEHDEGDNRVHTYTISHSNYDNVLGIKVVYGNQDRFAYIKPNDKWMLDHADIECADDGVYTTTSIYNDNGVLKKKVTRLQSFVSDVNSCVLYSGSGDSATTGIYDQNRELISGATGYVSGDYWKNPSINPGQPQFELTSKYRKEFNQQTGKWETVDGTVGRKRFYYAEVDHAVFDVKLELRKVSEVTYRRENGAWVEISSETFDPGSVTPQEISSAVFRLNHQSVIDAYNKCPNHSGLDFTIKSTAAMIELQGRKSLTNGRMVGNDFKFEIYDTKTNTVVATAYNDQAGTVLFDAISFDEAGEYTYKIREVKSVNNTSVYGNDDIVFDDTEYEFKVIISRNSEQELVVSDIISDTFQYDFENKVKFNLPSTGGPGVFPVYAAGGLVILTALLLPFIRKRLEACMEDE